MLPLAFRQVHLDFHTSELIPGIGARFEPERFADTLAAAHVNSITCFSKCHHGMIYHDTRFEARHPHLAVDLLHLQIEACHARGIRVPIYISVGLDEFMARRHPEWIELQPDGKRRGEPLKAGWKKLCLNTAYVEYVSAQTQEVLSRFPTDGLFFDIIHQGQCCCPVCLAGMTGDGLDPECESDRKQYARGVLARLMDRVTTEVRDVNERCLIFWNSGHVDPSFRRVLHNFSHLELESLPSGGWGYDHFPLTVRYARHLGRDYLGMTGKFQKTWAGFGEFKNLAALEYECFTSLAEGAKLSIGDQLHPDGELDAATYDLIGTVYSQAEAREPWCGNVTPVTEIAIYNPEELGVHDGRVDTSSGGAYRMLSEAHYQCDVVDREMDWSAYGVLILPDKIRLDGDLAARLQGYLAGGGRLIASHRSGLAADRDEFVLPDLGVTWLDDSPFEPEFIAARAELSAGVPAAPQVVYERGARVAPAVGTSVLADVWQPYFNRTYAHFCSHRHTPAEKPSGYPGAVASANAVYFAHPLFAGYMRHGVLTYKRLVLNALRRLLPEEQRLTVSSAPSTARISLMRQAADASHGGRHVLHLLHSIPEQRCREIQTIEEHLPLHNVRVGVRLPGPPASAYLAPDREALECDWRDGRAWVNVPLVLGHAMVVFE